MKVQALQSAENLTSPDPLPMEIVELCDRLQTASGTLDRQKQWPKEQLQWCRQAEVFRWFIPAEYGGFGWSELDILEGYLALSQSCLTTTFVLTQWNAACKRILSSDNEELKSELLPAMARGDLFVTVGISHLTTSRQHLHKPVLVAELKGDEGFSLNGFSPWVTGAAFADVIVTGATLPDGRQMMAAIPVNNNGMHPRSGVSLVALDSSCTDQVDFEHVAVAPNRVIAGPVENVMQVNSGGGAGGLQTSTLAVGLSMAAARFLREQAASRPDLERIAAKMTEDVARLHAALRQLTIGEEAGLDTADLRREANSLVLRCTQAALTAAKGAGFVATHPTGRWAREALFFLVWSCPQPVATAHLCEFAQISNFSS